MGPLKTYSLDEIGDASDQRQPQHFNNTTRWNGSAGPGASRDEMLRHAEWLRAQGYPQEAARIQEQARGMGIDALGKTISGAIDRGMQPGRDAVSAGYDAAGRQVQRSADAFAEATRPIGETMYDAASRGYDRINQGVVEPIRRRMYDVTDETAQRASNGAEHFGDAWKRHHVTEQQRFEAEQRRAETEGLQRQQRWQSSEHDNAEQIRAINETNNRLFGSDQQARRVFVPGQGWQNRLRFMNHFPSD